MTPQADWSGVLRDGETVLWQGRPAPTLRFRIKSPVQAFQAVFFAGFGVAWIAMTRPVPVPVWPFGLIFLGLGLYQAVGVQVWDAYLRRHTRYALTDRRAVIATRPPWGDRRLSDYAIAGDTVLDFDGADPGTIWFAHRTRNFGRSGEERLSVGFELIPEARKVYGLMRDVQRGSG
ncbi:MAG: hypothetical protein QNJ16_12930 [Rhodobacter sp.]|nr:hypothetical protein [Rhodobacter sp.]